MTTAIVTIIMFLVMISIHEFGHFIAGKALGFTVLEYAIGFGPVILKKQKGETLYSVRLIPFGGFCRFAGEDGENTAEKGNFNEQSCPKRITVLVAGALFNIILGFVLFCIITGMTDSILTNRIQTVIPGTYLAETDIVPGDEIIKINGKRVSMYQDISLYMSEIKGDSEINLTVRRENGEKKTVSFMPSVQNVKITYTEDNIIYEERINEKSAEQIIEYSEDVQRDEKLLGTVSESSRFLIGFSPVAEDVTFLNAIPHSFRMTGYVVKLLYKTVWELLTGKQSMDVVSGPVGVVREVNNAVNSGDRSLLYVLNLVALLTINLGVFNLLPLPALDGGRLLFVVLEWIRRKPVPAEKEGAVHAIGFMLLIGLMLFISYRDVINLFKG